jgi:uridine kinase
MRTAQAFESVSTWRQPMPPPASTTRSALIADAAARVAGIAPGRLRVAVDGAPVILGAGGRRSG